MLRAGIVDPQIAEAAGRAAVSGEPIDVELRPVEPTASLAAPRPRRLPCWPWSGRSTTGGSWCRPPTSRRRSGWRPSAGTSWPTSRTSSRHRSRPWACWPRRRSTRADDPEAVRRFAGKLQSESIRLGALVNELIALSRLQGAEPLPDLAVVEVDAVVDETIARVATAAENAGIDGDLGRAVRPAGPRRPVAAGHRPDQPGGQRRSTTRRPAPRCRSAGRCATGRCEIAVTDRGVGIAPEYTERVFERFFRIDPARSRATGGTGLGLAIVKHVAANHGGTATVWSRPGTGSTFTLRLPDLPASCRRPPIGRRRSAPVADRPMPAPRPARPRSTVTKVLIVEDEESMADPLAFLLRQEGFSTEIAAHRSGGAGRVRPERRRHRAARRDAARDERHRGVQAAAGRGGRCR